MSSSPTLAYGLRGFLLRAFGLFALWLGLYYGWLEPDGRLDERRTEQVTAVTSHLLHLTGYPVTTKPANAPGEAAIHLKVMLHGRKVLGVGHGCNALVLMALFAGFVMAYPGDWRVKAVFIPAGVLLIELLNYLRLYLLVLAYLHYPEWVAFHHKFTFVVVVYAAIFGLWMWWAQRLSSLQWGRLRPS